jgi:hypothetical protein
MPTMPVSFLINKLITECISLTMDVNKDNWKECLKLFMTLINDINLCFISMDCEMTGISRFGDSFKSQNAYEDTPEERYLKLVSVVVHVFVRNNLSPSPCLFI